MGISPYRLAKDTGVPGPRIYDLLREKRGVSADTALRLSRYFGLNKAYWFRVQARYDHLVRPSHRLRPGRGSHREGSPAARKRMTEPWSYTVVLLGAAIKPIAVGSESIIKPATGRSEKRRGLAREQLGSRLGGYNPCTLLRPKGGAMQQEPENAHARRWMGFVDGENYDHTRAENPGRRT